MLNVRVTDYKAMSTMTPHAHDEPSLIVVLKGNYRECIDGNVIEYSAGEMLWYPAGAMHSQKFGPAGARKIVYTPTPLSLEYLRASGVPTDAPSHADARGTMHIARRLLAEMRGVDQLTPIVIEGIGLELVAAFVRCERSKFRNVPAWVRAARNVIRDSDGEAISLSAVAAEVGRHPVHLAREFRRYFGVSVGEYQRRLRLQRAEAMLRQKTGLMEIALTCGFASHSHLTRAFKAAYGVTPSEFRAQG